MNLKNRILKKSNLWHVGALLLFVVLSCIYFAPALDGYALKQPDIVNHVGMSSEVADYRNNSDEQVQWTNSMFSGMPPTWQPNFNSFNFSIYRIPEMEWRNEFS